MNDNHEGPVPPGAGRWCFDNTRCTTFLSISIKTIVRKSYGYMNNHADAKSVANAIELKHFLGEHVPEDLNPDMLKRYPELKAIVRDESQAGCADAVSTPRRT
jgi:hypothetical protein